LKYLKNHIEWNNRWRFAIAESPIGHPFPYPFYWRSSGALIQHAYHIAQLEEKTGSHIDEMNYILEFGGGYGSMCRLINNLGFRGVYIIYDLAPFSALQEYYLKSLGLRIHLVNTPKMINTGILCVSDLDVLESMLMNSNRIGKSLFIATWSLSEAPIAIRDTMLPLISKFDKCLITYQDRFGEINNIEYFDKWVSINKERIWKSWEIDHLRHNYYLIGERENLHSIPQNIEKYGGRKSSRNPLGLST
jgi:hypothetical protein